MTWEARVLQKGSLTCVERGMRPGRSLDVCPTQYFFFLGADLTYLFAMFSNLGGGREKKGHKRILKVLLKGASKISF